ncbi:DUF2491 domain-containing protein [Vreelandella rituensis]|uniref:DUF2491 family protein n=1 Tax=Vreelandella rituensis TaxID=2282306 RepID=A0A368TW29_9GAMM|nr:DUF2491 family protein [Halomonas rituensis]RCV88791.1 DUF2491 family protein [Halomonas rituensis]
MFKTLKALLRSTQQDTRADNSAIPATGLPPMVSLETVEGLRLDGRVKIQLIGLRAHEDALFAWDDDSYHHIAAVGHVDLGQGSHLVRFYLDNDTWLQANIEHGHVIEYKLFDFYRVAHVSDSEFDTLINGVEKKADTLGANCVTLTAAPPAERSCEFNRVWGAPDSLWSAPVVFEESVTTLESLVPRQVRHHAMLYERNIQASERMEYLLISAEDDGQGSFMVVYNLGVDVASVDIDAL